MNRSHNGESEVNELVDWLIEEISEDELLKKRTRGFGSILETLFHIADVEWSWIRLLERKDDFQEDFEKYNSLEKVRKLDAKFRPKVGNFVTNWNDSIEYGVLKTIRRDGTIHTDQWGEVMRHVITHEIHHVGQL